MKRVLIVGNNDIGLHNFRIELIEELIALGNEVYFSVPLGDKVKDIKKIGAKYYLVDLKRHGVNPIQELILLNSYRTMISKIKPDIILTYTIKPNLYVGILARLRKTPYIATVTGLGTMFQNSGIKRKLIEKAYKFATGKAKAVFFQNLTNQQTFVDGGIVQMERAVLVNGSGVNIEKFKPNRQDHEGVNFLFIGRIMRDKGIVEYLQAAETVKSKNDKANFYIVGNYDDIDLNDMVEDYERRGIVSYRGMSLDTRLEMSKADCIVLPSYHEGMSNVLLEGAASGIPLIASDIPGCKEIIQEDVSGYLISTKSSADLAEAIDKFISLEHFKKEKMGIAGRTFVEMKFDRKEVIQKYLKIIQAL